MKISYINKVKNRLYCLLSLNVALFMIIQILNHFHKMTIPSDMYELLCEAAVKLVANKSILLIKIYTELAFLNKTVYILSIIGMFFCIGSSRKYYVLSVAIKLLLGFFALYQPSILTKYHLALIMLLSTTEGVILYSVFFGREKVLYRRTMHQVNTASSKTKRNIICFVKYFCIVFIVVIFTISITGIGPVPSMLNTPTEFSRKMVDNAARKKYDLSSKQFENQFFKLTTPQDWHAQFCDDKPSLYMSNILSNRSIDGDFVMSPIILFGCGFKESTNIFSNGLYSFLNNTLETQVFTKDINGETARVSRYSGHKSWHHEKEDNVVINDINSTTILVEFDGIDCGFGFWGFEKDEQVFWECLNSIEWKE